MKLSDYTNTEYFISGDKIEIEDGKIKLIQDNPVYLADKDYLDFLVEAGRNNVGLNTLLSKEKGELTFDLKKFKDSNYSFIQYQYDYSELSSPRCFWRDSKGQYYHEPLLFNERHGLHDTNYFLDDFAEVLSQRNDVAFLVEKGNKYHVLRAPIKSEPLIGHIISDIEHHLEDGEAIPPENEHIQLIYFPQENIIGKSTKDIIDNILGGVQFLKPKVDEKDLPKRKFKNV